MKKRTSSIMWGLLFVSGAAFIILSALGYVNDVSVVKIIFTVVFAGIIISNIPYWNFWGIFLPMAGIGIIYADIWGIEKLSPWPLLIIAVFLSIGFSLIFKSGRNKNANRYYNSNGNNANNNYNQNYVGKEDCKNGQWETEYINQGVNNTVDCSVKFSSAIKYVKMDNLERANINLSFGAMEVYFDGCLIPAGHAQINVNGKFGSIVLYIPRNWKVIINTATMAGSVSEKNRPQLNENSPEVVIAGNVQFGAVEIQYV